MTTKDSIGLFLEIPPSFGSSAVSPMTPPIIATPLLSCAPPLQRQLSQVSLASSDADDDDYHCEDDEKDWTECEDDILISTYMTYVYSPPRSNVPPGAPFAASAPPYNVTYKIAKIARSSNSELSRAHSLPSIRKRIVQLARKHCGEERDDEHNKPSTFKISRYDLFF